MNVRRIGAFLLAAAVIFGGISLKGYLAESRAGSSYEQLQEDVAAQEDEQVPEEPEESVQEAAAEAVETVPEEVQEPEPEPVVIPIDFEQLQAECPEAYAWIRIPDTKIDYPIMQSGTDNTFYLDHNSYGNYEFAGAIFTEDYNKKDFSDPNTIIYGHNMKNGSMFQNLHFFEDETFFEEHTTFEIYLPEQILTYKIFAAYNYDDRHLMKSFDFTDKEQFKQYLQEIRDRKYGNFNWDAEVDENDRIVTLSTCNGINDQRYLVQGVLLSE